MKIAEKRAWIDLRVEAECDECGKQYAYDYRIKEEGWSVFDIEGRVRLLRTQ